MSSDRHYILPPLSVHTAPTSKLPPFSGISRGKRLSNALRLLSHEVETFDDEALDVVEEAVAELRQRLEKP